MLSQSTAWRLSQRAFLCWQLLDTQTSLSLKSRLCWNCHMIRCTDLLLDMTVRCLSTCYVYRRWNTGTTPSYGTQQCWSTWPSTTQTALFTRSGTLLRTEDMGSHCSTAAPTETFSHKGKGLEKEKQVPRGRYLSALDLYFNLIFCEGKTSCACNPLHFLHRHSFPQRHGIIHFSRNCLKNSSRCSYLNCSCFFWKTLMR